MSCAACHRDIEIVAKGFCEACYRRQLRHGTTAYLRLGKRTPCHINGCTGRAVSHGLCAKHRQRLRSHGTTDLKHDWWGAKKKHPLYNQWMHMRRYRGLENVSPEWQTDFLQFVNDIGDRPSPKHKLFPANLDLPFGPGNFVWKTAITERVPGEDEKTYAARRARVYRKMNPEGYKKYDLKKTFGLSQKEFDEMHAAQNGKCAICGSEETVKIRGRAVSLAVDHCHTSGKVRGLLCSSCNPALGGFRDRIDLLEAAIAYLRQNGAAPSQ